MGRGGRVSLVYLRRRERTLAGSKAQRQTVPSGGVVSLAACDVVELHVRTAGHRQEEAKSSSASRLWRLAGTIRRSPRRSLPRQTAAASRTGPCKSAPSPRRDLVLGKASARRPCPSPAAAAPSRDRRRRCPRYAHHLRWPPTSSAGVRGRQPNLFCMPTIFLLEARLAASNRGTTIPGGSPSAGPSWLGPCRASAALRRVNGGRRQ